MQVIHSEGSTIWFLKAVVQPIGHKDFDNNN